MTIFINFWDSLKYPTQITVFVYKIIFLIISSKIDGSTKTETIGITAFYIISNNLQYGICVYTKWIYFSCIFLKKVASV